MDDTRSALRLDDDDPWPGLAAYDEASQRFFHGRDRDSAELLRLIRLWPFVTLYGKSGLGKSSMLQAGLFPQLRAARFLPVHLRLDYTERAGQPLLTQAAQRLRQEIDAAGADAPPPDDDESLWAYLQRRERPIWTPDNYPLTPVLVFDQFEEVFSRGGSPDHVQAVLDGMADLVGDRVPAALAEDRDAARRLNLQSQQYRVVLSFRSDFLAEVEGWEKRANLPRRESLHLTAMSRERAIESVERAGEKVLEPGVATQIVDFLLHREGRAARDRGTEVEPVLLSLCCYQLNRRRQRPARIDAALLHTVGEGILKGFYDEALADMPQKVSVFIEEHLIQGDRYRNSYALEEALDSGALTRAELDQLTDSRLLRVDPQGEVPRIELIHDRLVSIVRDARDVRLAREEAADRVQAEREDQQRQQEEAEERARAERDRERLEQTEREGARVARWRNGLAVAVAGLVVASGFLISYWREAIDQRRTDNIRAEEVANAKTVLENDKANLEDELQRARLALQAALAERSPARGGQPGGPVGAPAGEPAIPQAVVIPPTAPTATPPLVVERWTLSSGGCNQGEVTVRGELTVTITSAGSGVEVSEAFKGRGGGFTVTAAGKKLFDKPQPSYVVETNGDWSGPGRTFSTTGVDEIFVRQGVPERVRFRKIATRCP